LVGAAACSIPSNFVSTRTFPVGKEGADNPPTMGAETADHTLQFGHDLLLSLPLLSLSLRFKLSLFTTFLLYSSSSPLEEEEFRPAPSSSLEVTA
jgi:hypothetical protein